jgi:hypothetical protein
VAKRPGTWQPDKDIPGPIEIINHPLLKSLQKTSERGVPGGYDGRGTFSERFGKINTICSLYAGYEQDH